MKKRTSENRYFNISCILFGKLEESPQSAHRLLKNHFHKNCWKIKTSRKHSKRLHPLKFEKIPSEFLKRKFGKIWVNQSDFATHSSLLRDSRLQKLARHWLREEDVRILLLWNILRQERLPFNDGVWTS